MVNQNIYEEERVIETFEGEERCREQEIIRSLLESHGEALTRGEVKALELVNYGPQSTLLHIAT